MVHLLHILHSPLADLPISKEHGDIDPFVPRREALPQGSCAQTAGFQVGDVVKTQGTQVTWLRKSGEKVRHGKNIGNWNVESCIQRQGETFFPGRVAKDAFVERACGTDLRYYG